MNKQVLLINDIAGYGKVALSAMIPVMSHMGSNIHNLPTAVVSNNLEYGKFDILDTTDYMKRTLAIWAELGFRFDAVATGFIVNEEQVEIISDFCHEQSKKGTVILCDPIMGDEGHLYPGIPEETIENMRNLISCSDYVVPNYTEAALLTNRACKSSFSEDEIRTIIDDLRALGAKSVVITSTTINNEKMIACYDHISDKYFTVPYENVETNFPGTRDIFASVLLGSIMNGKTLQESVTRAAKTVRLMILKSLKTDDRLRGIDIENCWEEIGA